jgi:hypothetical protein
MFFSYKFQDTHTANNLQKELDYFFGKLSKVNPADPFNPDTLFSGALKDKVKAKYKGNPVKLYEYFSQFYSKFILITPKKNRDKLINIYHKMNDIGLIRDTKIKRYTNNDIDTRIKKEVKELFDFLYSDVLDTYDIKDHYSKHYEDPLHSNWCTFCGMETLPHYTHLKSDYDHLLAKSIYPFCAINMKNLVPMGTKCNRDHKKDEDIIYYRGSRNKGFNPYKLKFNISITFEETKLPRPTRRDGEWKLNFHPNEAETQVWAGVFNMEDRIIKDHLTNPGKSDYDTWIETFIKINKTKKINSVPKLKIALKEFASSYDFDRYKQSRYVTSDLFYWMSKNANDTVYNSLLRMLN